MIYWNVVLKLFIICLEVIFYFLSIIFNKENIKNIICMKCIYIEIGKYGDVINYKCNL